MDDRHRYNPEPHYRLYLSPRDNKPTLICVQANDYLDYDDSRFLSPDAWDDEIEAECALGALQNAMMAAVYSAQGQDVADAMIVRLHVAGWALTRQAPGN